jgi:hypothetical protein
LFAAICVPDLYAGMKEEPEKMIFLQSAHKDPAVILLGVPIWANSS